eukprot:gnl/Spiro4/7869_TR4140_c0_g2_i1.p1 gnl/Spiro4/7869_TR4140_c0_g2~~gnl/Spiro4/7869_TR4140_c0_g2_i1.p1  ORF type:complete len:365 (+),score=110.07 gnl/Spiro4/7869_TR4140_c0_g2_i1:673-1767(+)
MFDTMLEMRGHVFSMGALLVALLWFFVVFIVSLIIGIGLGLVTAFVFKHIKISPPHFEFALLTISAYISYVLAQVLHMSGIVTLFFFGIITAHYNLYNMSKRARTTATTCYHTVSFLAETFLFAYLGLAIFDVAITREYHTFLVFATIIICLLARLIGVYGLSFILNLFRTRQITFNIQFAIWFTGLRGAVAFALALVTKDDLIITTTLYVVLFTTIILGGLVKPLMLHLDFFKSPEELAAEDAHHEAPVRRRLSESDEQELAVSASTAAVDAGTTHMLPADNGGNADTEHTPGTGGLSPDGHPLEPDSQFHGFWRTLDDKYLKNWFGGRRKKGDKGRHDDDEGEETVEDSAWPGFSTEGSILR